MKITLPSIKKVGDWVFGEGRRVLRYVFQPHSFLIFILLLYTKKNCFVYMWEQWHKGDSQLCMHLIGVLSFLAFSQHSLPFSSASARFPQSLPKGCINCLHTSFSNISINVCIIFLEFFIFWKRQPQNSFYFLFLFFILRVRNTLLLYKQPSKV